MPIRVLIADSNAGRREILRQALASDPEMEIAGQARDGQEAGRMASVLRPNIVLLVSDLVGWDGFETAERLTAFGLLLETILISVDERPGDLRRAMRAGARDCLLWPLAPEILCAAVRQISEDHRRRHAPGFADANTSANIIAVTGAKGGIGKTTLSVNLAAALAVTTGEPTALLDLYTQFGDAALLLNVVPRRTLADLVSIAPTDLDERLLEDHLERHDCGLHLLAGAATPLPVEALSPDLLDRILNLARGSYRHIVLDVPPVLTETTRGALSQAAHILLIANLFDLTTLADSRLWLDSMAGHYLSREAVHIVLNRVSPRNRLPLVEIERAFGELVFQQVPNDGRLVPASVNTGVPFVLSHPGSRVSQSIFEIARQFTSWKSLPAAVSAVAAEAPRRPAFLSPLLRRGGGA